MRWARWFAFAAALWVPLATYPQSYPTRPVRIIVPFSPGGATDIVTRILGQKYNEMWGQTIVVDNRAGASGNIGADLAVKSNPDGHTLFMTSGSIVTANQHIHKKMTYDAERDLVAITNCASGPQLLVVHPGFPAKSVNELIAMAKAKPGSLNFGSAGFGTQTHLAAENFLYTANINVNHVPYKGEAPALVDLVAGHINFLTPNLSAAIGFVKQGRLRALGVTSKQRLPQLPDIPAVAESLPGFENLGWFGLMAPTGTPKSVIEKVYRDTVTVLNLPDVKKRYEEIGMVGVGNSPAAFAHQIKEESQRWAKIVRERKLQLD
jgi:tripartite-type tricarboxylate transporter receptor subunit TctC